MQNDREAILQSVRDEVLQLTVSPLYAYRIANNAHPVIGQGDHRAALMLIGEAPGKREAETGRPFCGASGRVLDQLFESIGMHREDVYVTNIVKDRPPMNRDPLPAEIALYAPFLDRQIDAIRPRVIATLGRFSMAYILQSFGLAGHLQPIGKLHGQVFTGHASYGEVYIVPLYHPAVALYNGSMKQQLIDDFAVIKLLLNK